MNSDHNSRNEDCSVLPIVCPSIRVSKQNRSVEVNSHDILCNTTMALLSHVSDDLERMSLLSSYAQVETQFRQMLREELAK
jgi:hypothetical protein